MSMFIGGLLAWVFARLHAKKAERYGLSVAAGFTAGEPLMAVVVAALIAANVLQAG